MCLLVEFMEYKAWRKREYGADDVQVEYADFLEAYQCDQQEAGFWQEDWKPGRNA